MSRLPHACRTQAGFILMPVMLTLSLLALLAFWMGRQTGTSAYEGATLIEQSAAHYAAAAGLAEAWWTLQANNCSWPGDISGTLAGRNYNATVNFSSATSAALIANADLDGGGQLTLRRDQVLLQSTPPPPLVLQPSGDTGKDTHLANAGQSDANQDGAVRLSLSNNGPNLDNVLLRFDLSTLPAQAIINSATLELYLEGIGSGVTATANVYRVTKAWSETQASWTRATTSQTWTTAGGDHAATAAAGVTITPSGGWISWDVTPLTQAWVDGNQPNFGMLIKTPTANVNNANFISSDDAGQPNRWPKLTVNYSCGCGQPCASAAPPGYYRDEFRNTSCSLPAAYAGSDGTADWSATPWEETADGNTDPCAGQLKLWDDYASQRLRFVGGGLAIQRPVDLSGYSVARLSFDYRREYLDAPSDALIIEMSSDGGTVWQEVSRIQGPGTDTVYTPTEYNVDAHISANAMVRFRTVDMTGSGSNAERLFIDNVQFDNTQVYVDPTFGETLSIPPDHDTWISDLVPNTPQGGHHELKTGLDSNNYTHDTMLHFDLGAIPPGSLINSAILALNVKGPKGNQPIPVSAYRLQNYAAPWDENSVTWNTRPANHYDPALPLATADVPFQTTQRIEWTLPPEMIQEWLDGVGLPNYGVLLHYDGTTKNRKAEADSMDSGVDPGLKPELVINFVPP